MQKNNQSKAEINKNYESTTDHFIDHNLMTTIIKSRLSRTKITGCVVVITIQNNTVVITIQNNTVA